MSRGKRRAAPSFDSFLRQHRRAELMARHHGKCHWCRKQVRNIRHVKGSAPHDMATEDHIICKSAGGSDQLSNLVLCCFACNDRRGNIEAGVFETIMRGFQCEAAE